MSSSGLVEYTSGSFAAVFRETALARKVGISIKWNLVGLAAMVLVGVLAIPTYGAFGAALAMAAWRLLGAGGVLFETWRLLIRFHQTAQGNR
ncbi:hypothetical protein ACFLT4_02610 [Chloroflexota bacterium]